MHDRAPISGGSHSPCPSDRYTGVKPLKAEGTPGFVSENTMSDNGALRDGGGCGSVTREQLVALLRARYEAADRVRRGVCLLAAGQFDRAEATFKQAIELGSTDESLASYLAACLLGRRRPDAAAEQFASAIQQEASPTASRIRHALSLWAAGKAEQAIHSLREGLNIDPECAEYHFQLGLLLAGLDRFDEAELRFTQAVNIQRDHTDALVNLALCCGVRRAPNEAVPLLHQAHTLRPHDPRIGLLLAQAAKAAREQGHAVHVRTEMPADSEQDDDAGIEELSRAIEQDPDFVDAFLSIPVGEVHERVFAMLLKTLERALERQPEHAELHFHCGRVLARVGRHEDAIGAAERAVAINPTYTRALIELAKLYQQTDRRVDAMTRLEQAIASGAEYADVYFLLGNLHRDQGQVIRAREAYERALVLNDHYGAARQALEALPVI
jgi:tetratricopeptide (TPR) repeat protein